MAENLETKRALQAPSPASTWNDVEGALVKAQERWEAAGRADAVLAHTDLLRFRSGYVSDREALRAMPCTKAVRRRR